MSSYTKISRKISQSSVVQAIVNYGPVSRASVAKITGLSKQTVSEIVAKLEAKGWVRAVGQTEGHIGRRAVVYELSPTAALVASVDLGGTKVRAALCDLNGRILYELLESTDPKGGINIVHQITRMVRNLVSNSGNSYKGLHTAVIGVPGVEDNETGEIHLAPNITGIDKINFAECLRKELGIEIIVENDVNLSALGEHWHGDQGEHDSLVFLSIGTGVGAGIVLGGNLLRGSFGAAGEVGFLPIGTDPNEPESLNSGALERATATWAIINNYKERSGIDKTVPEVFEAAASGDKYAIEVLDNVARNLAFAIAAVVAIIDPSKIIVGGSIGSRPELLKRITQYASHCIPRQIKIEKTRLGNKASLAGGVATALYHLHLSLFAEGQDIGTISVPPAPAIENFKVCEVQ